MKIAQIAPLAESVPPRLYGGAERVVSYLTEELIRLGHEVTRFASADSNASARVDAHGFDVLHFHVEHARLPAIRPWPRKSVTTLHGRLDLPGLEPLYREFDDMALVSISNAQRRPLAHANWVGTVYHGLPGAVCPYNPAPRGQYLAFIGRGSPEKGLERAIEIARRAARPLRVAARIDPADESYWQRRIPDSMIDFVGEVSEEQKPALLGNAAALLFPVDPPEPFGLAMIEAMSCGTPVIAWPHGLVPEVVEHGVTGFLVDSVEQAVAAVHDLPGLGRARVRRRFEERFSARRMASDYLAVYRSLGSRRQAAH